MAGGSLGSDSFTVPGFGNIDFAINDMPGFSEFDFGVINAVAIPTGCLAGEMGLFAPIGDGQFFSTEVNITNLGGEQKLFSLSDGRSSNACYAAFNTFNPSLNPADSALPITHWLQVANLETENKETFTVNRYDSTGALIANEKITLDAGGRVDVAAGHEDAVMNRYGLVEVIPDSPGIEYTAQIFRYGVDQSSIELEHLSSFNMAENCSTGSGASQYVSVSNGASANNWLELQNLSTVKETVVVRLYSNTSGEKSVRSFELEPLSSVHVNAVEGFDPGESGLAEVRPVNGMPILVTSTSYLYEADGRVNTAFSSTGRALLGSEAVSSYNTFRNQLNWLRVYNVRNGEVTVTATALDQSGQQIGVHTFTLGSKSGVDINLNEALSLPVGVAVGQVQFSVSKPAAVFAEIARVEHNADYTRVIEIETFAVK